MSAYYVSFVTRDVPYTYSGSIDEPKSEDIFYLERIHHINPKEFVLIKHTRDCIVLNKNLKNLKEIKEIIEKVMRSRCMPQKLLDRFVELTDTESSYILQKYFHDWRKELRKREFNRQTLSMPKSTKSLRISWKVKRNKQIIKELFDIEYGVYEQLELVCSAAPEGGAR